MKYLSFDLEATGLAEKDLIIEFAMIPFNSDNQTFNKDLAMHTFVKCPSFLELKPNLDPWVIEHNENLITKAHNDGIEISKLKMNLESWLTSEDVIKYFELKDGNKITLFGKSLNAIDLPFLNRDLGYDFMREYFNHQTLDLSSIVMGLIDMNKIPVTCLSGSELMKHFNMGEVAHTALEDAISTAKIYFNLINL